MKRTLSLFTFGIAAALLIFIMSLQAYGDSKFWIGGSGNWDEGSNWNPAGQPQKGDSVYLTQSDEVHRAVNYINNLYVPSQDVTPPDIASITIDSTGAGIMNFILSGDRLVTGSQYIGYDGKGTFTQTDGFNSAVAAYLGYNSSGVGTYNLGGGTFIGGVGGPDFIGYSGVGTFNQTDGVRGAVASLVLGSQPGSTGTYNLSRGTFITPYWLIVGNQGTGLFNQTGGAVDVDELQVGSKGIYNLSGGTLRSAYGNANVAGTFNQTEGTHTVPWGGQPARLSISGTYNLAGGTLTVGSYGSPIVPSFNANAISNGGSFNYSGGSLNANVVNTGTVILSGRGTRTINGSEIINNGTFKISNTTVAYTGSFTNYGAYVSDPATNTFNHLIVGSLGYLKGGAGDRFFINGHFENFSIRNTLWDTMEAYLEFAGSGAHNFYLAGADLGPGGSFDNFAWDTLQLDSEVILKLFDGNAGNHDAALYVGELAGAMVDGQRITNIFGEPGLYLYYDPADPGNHYLAGLTYSLEGGGWLEPGSQAGTGQPVPEPGTMLLLGIGLVGLAAARRKRLKR
jgi:hypothetical protein